MFFYFLLFGILVVIIMAIALTCWVKAPPDVAFILSGWRAKPRMLVGQGGSSRRFQEQPFAQKQDAMVYRYLRMYGILSL